MASRRFRIEFTVDMDCWDANNIKAFAIQELTSMSPYPRDIEFSEVGWHTGTPTEEGYYLLQYLNSGEYDVGRWDGSDFVIEENLPMVLTSHRSVAWQRIEPYKEENNG